MYVSFDNLEDVLIVSLVGELDHHSAEEVRVKVDDRIDRDNIKKLVIDFSGVTFMDSSGIGVVIGRYKKMMLRKGIVSVASVSKNIKRVFELSGIFKIINVYGNIEDAVKVG